MDIEIEELDKQPMPSPTTDKKGVKDEFKGYETTKSRSHNLDLLFSALKTIPPSSTEDRFRTHLTVLS